LSYFWGKLSLLMKIITILGARPQFIKAASLSRSLAKHNITEVLVHTGQHYDANMSQIFFKELHIPKPKYNLNIRSKLHGEMTGRILEKSERVIQKERPDLLVVYGDTNSTLGASLAAAKLNIPIAHIESGLRSFNRKMPEEINRILTDQVSSYLFCPTTAAVKNLEAEGVDKGKIFNVGDIMLDSMMYYRALLKDKSTIRHDLGIDKPYILVTIHRAENTDNPKRLKEILNQLKKVAKKRDIVLPLHPRTRTKLNLTSLPSGLKIISPVGYFQMIDLQMNSSLVITDSGGIQKEAYWNGKYCITLRQETEWVELVQEGMNTLAEPTKILLSLVEKFFGKSIVKEKQDLYGDGNTSERIIRVLKQNFK
jgi:UDP-GlcNAc3NAcA epimerase